MIYKVLILALFSLIENMPCPCGCETNARG